MSWNILATVPQNDLFFSWFWYFIQKYWPLFLSGIQYTVFIALTGTLIGLVLALFVTPLKIQTITSRDTMVMATLKRLGIILTTIYVEVLRGTPMMVQAVIIYYGLYGMGVDLTLTIGGTQIISGIFVYGILIVSINTSAYITEVLRGSISAIDKGQMEAARSLGMTRAQAMRHIIIPQAFKNSIPAIGNEFVINIKDTAVLSVIAVNELFRVARQLNARYYRYEEIFIIAAIFYLILTLSTTRILYFVSNKIGSSKEKPILKSFPTSQN